MPDPNMSDEQFARWFASVSRQNEQIRRMRGMETAAERIARLRADLGDYQSRLGHRVWHDWRSPGLRNDCTRLDGHPAGCRRVSESIENRPLPASPDVPRYVIVVEAMVSAR